jgi:MFS transporter, DHA3 family, macrolide efflux protein
MSEASAVVETPADSAAAPPVLDPEMPKQMSMGAVLGITMMRRLWTAQVISVFGDFLALYAVISVLTFRLHATASQVTGVQVAYLLPIAVLGVIAGVFVDRWPLKTTMIGSDALRAALVLALVAAGRLWHFYAVLAAVSVVSSFFAPAQGVAIRSAVPLHGLRAANALMQQVMFGMRIMGPAVAAFLVASFGPVSCYVGDSASFAISALLITSVAFAPRAQPAPQAPAAGGETSGIGRVWLDMKQGIDFIFHHASLLFVILAMASGMFVIGCFGPLIAIYVRDILHGSTKIFGISSALIGVGMLIGINVLGAAAKNVKSSILVYGGLGGIAVGLAFMVAATYIWSTLLGNFLIGMAVAGIVIPAQTLIQQETPQALLGRVGSTVMSLVFTAQISGLLLSGYIAAAIGVRRVFAVCAVLVVLLIAAGRLWMEPKGEATAAARN